MANSIIVNGTTLDGWQDNVYFNGTALDYDKRVYFNDTEVWRRHRYQPNSVIIDYTWVPDSTVASFVNTVGPAHPYAFAVAPFFYQGSGGPDTRVQFTLADDYRVTYYDKRSPNQGTDTDGTGVGNTGGTFRIWQGKSVTGLEVHTSGYSLSVTSSGNGSSRMKISYVPYE